MTTFEVANYGDIMAFSGYCAVVGGVIFLIDLIAYKLKGADSLLGIVYRGNNSFILFLLWTLGAGLMGMLGGYAEILQLNRQAVLALGIGWPIILSRLIKQSPQAFSDDETEAAG